MVKGGGVMRIGLDGSREVLDGLNRVVVSEKGLNQLNGVEPLVRCALYGSVVEVVTVKVNIGSLCHDLSSCKLQGPQPSAGTLHRLDRVWRLDEGIIAKLSSNCNRVSNAMKGALT